MTLKRPLGLPTADQLGGGGGTFHCMGGIMHVYRLSFRNNLTY